MIPPSENAPESRSRPLAVTMRDVAEASGLSRAAVSLALRNHPSIPEATRQKVRDAAARLGYRQNALISTLMTNLRRGRHESECPVLAWLSSAFHDQQRKIRFYGESERGALDRAAQLGFSIEVYPMPGFAPVEWARTRRILLARGVQGVIFGPQAALPPDIHPWLAPFAAVALGPSHGDARLPRVQSFLYHSCQAALARMGKVHGPRIALWLPIGFDERTEHAVLGAYASHWLHQGRTAPEVHLRDKIHPGEFRAWLERAKPDGLLCVNEEQAEVVERHAPAFGGRIALLDWQPGSRWPGMDQFPYQIGQSLTDLLVAQIHRNERGLPPYTKVVVVEPGWRQAGEQVEAVPVRAREASPAFVSGQAFQAAEDGSAGS